MGSTNVLSSIVIGIASSVTASIIVTLALYFLRPTIKISPTIARRVKGDKTEYVIKIINKSKFELIDIKTTLIVARPANMPGGLSYKYDYMDMRTSNMFSIDRFDKKNSNAPYAILFVTEANLDDIWNSASMHIIFNIIAKHSFSGFSKSVKQHYHVKGSSIITGSFKHGNCLDVDERA